ncbi:DNA adenine methylase [Moorella sp. Hama-1]|uniref:DNA adenine methylase n=1 Tax=Moorella sp. Hama-1 TaxID=2138101 RepID=UPI000D65AF63|nr:DNA adenine methylase [Moorella sp. Hama-1]BCV21073.1 modification methylase [Moorella sp. Hama-1]
MVKNNLAAPLLKWAGGKRQIVYWILKYVPQTFTTYYEPFLGGGAVLFALQPEKAVVNDINSELINVYEVIRDNVEELIADLRKHRNEEAYFYAIRNLDRDKERYNRLTPIQRASRIIYLNKTCYNGLFRVNRAGEFNAPFGNYKRPNIVNELTLRAVSDYFNRAQITFTCRDFEAVLKEARKGAFVYLDPPYDPVSTTASFTGYSRGGFGKDEQIRLKETCDQLNKQGIKFLLSNSATDFIKELYKDYHLEIIQAKRAINSRADKRGEIDEVLVMNFT